jgi:hypothetical protein
VNFVGADLLCTFCLDLVFEFCAFVVEGLNLLYLFYMYNLFYTHVGPSCFSFSEISDCSAAFCSVGLGLGLLTRVRLPRYWSTSSTTCLSGVFGMYFRRLASTFSWSAVATPALVGIFMLLEMHPLFSSGDAFESVITDVSEDPPPDCIFEFL